MEKSIHALKSEDMGISVSGLVKRFDSYLSVQVRQGLIRQSTADFYDYQLVKLVRSHASRLARFLKPEQVRVKFTNHFVRAAKRLFAWAHEEGYVLKNHWRAVKVPASGERTRVLSDDEFVRLLSVCSPPFARLLRFGRETAARPGELREVQWGCVHLRERVILLRDFKSRDRRRDGVKVRPIRLTPLAVDLLAELRADNPDPSPEAYVFFDSDGYAWSSNALRCRMRRARQAAGLDVPGLERVVIYTMRHTRATELTKSGVRDNTLAEILGHADAQMTRRYQHLSNADLLDIIDRADASRLSAAG